MLRRIFPMFPGLLLAGGCIMEDSRTLLVPSNPFGVAPAVQQQMWPSHAPASLDVAARVDSMGRRIIEANPQLGVRPLFRTIGATDPEIFHVGTSEIDLTEGLVKQCATDGQLAAALCLELGRVISERESLTSPQTRLPERTPPMEVRVGSDNRGTFGPSDQLYRAELGKLDKERRQKTTAVKVPIDPQVLAREYLAKAGYSATELDAVSPVLHAAAENTKFAKQMIQPSTSVAPRP